MGRPRSGWRLVAFFAVIVATPGIARAQAGGDGFLFRAPRGLMTFSAGLDQPRGGSDLFDFVTEQLTVSRRDFRAKAWTVDVTQHITPRAAVLVSFGEARSTADSEFRDWLDNNRRPIKQATSLRRTPVTGSLKFYLTPPGRAVGRLAWIPRRVAVFAGAGGGLSHYRFSQKGDFIDFETFRVFYDAYESSGWQPLIEVYSGADITISRRLAATARVRYQHASGDLGSDFVGFDPIDLSGTSITTGLSIRY